MSQMTILRQGNKYKRFCFHTTLVFFGDEFHTALFLSNAFPRFTKCHFRKSTHNLTKNTKSHSLSDSDSGSIFRIPKPLQILSRSSPNPLQILCGRVPELSSPTHSSHSRHPNPPLPRLLFFSPALSAD